MLGIWCPENKTWLETPFDQIQEFHTFEEARDSLETLRRISAKENLGLTYRVLEIGPHGHPYL